MNILYLEDENEIREATCNTLSLAANEIKSCVNGVEAFEILDSGYKPDLIVTDLNMPKMDGFAFINKIKERGLTIPIIVLSGYYSYQDIKKFMETNLVREFLSKPTDMLLLMETINKIKRA